MSLMLAETYKAFLAAGAGEEQAAKAAAELAGYDSRVAQIDTTLVAFRGEMSADLLAFRGEMRADMAALRGDMALLKWTLGIGITLVSGLLSAVLLKIFL
jgi:hypothetical protein